MRYASDVDALPRSRRTAAFERRVATVLDRLVPAEARVLVACSGGADSTAALIAVARSGRAVTAAHFDHRLRPRAEGDADRAAVAALARTLNIALCGGEGSGASHAEDAARGERYRWLATAARAAGATHVVTGHTLDDQAETVLFRLARGTGLAGAAGMHETAPWPVPVEGSPALVRPLLGIARAEIEAYLAALTVEPRHDATNDDPAYSRNRIRRRVLPELRAINPRAAHVLADFAARAARDDAALEQWAEQSFAAITNAEAERVVIDRTALRALPPAVRARLLRHAAARFATPLESTHIEAAERAIRRSGTAIALPGARLRITRGEVILEIVLAPG